VLLRRLESGHYAFANDGDAAPLTAAEVAARLRGKLTNGQGLHLLVPAARCVVTSVPVAKHEARHLAKTLPWTLEERVLEPVEQLHVAHGPVVNGSASVAVINAAWLKQALDELRGAGIRPDSACSELFMLPWQAGRWTIFLPEASTAPVLVRYGAHNGFACARANLNTALQLLLNEFSEAPRQVQVLSPERVAHAEVTALIPVLLQSRIAMERQTLAQLLNTIDLPACNLLQGRFMPALPWAQWWRQWRVAAALLAGLLVSDFALSAYQGFRLNQEAERMEAEVVALYRTVQPDGTVVDPRLQLEQALAAAGVSGREGFLGLLSRMAPALQATPEAHVQNLEYDGSGTLQVQLLTSDYAVAENLRVKLQQLGLQAELLGSNRVGAGSLTRLRVGGGA
jgi:general secretion pathway protein L